MATVQNKPLVSPGAESPISNSQDEKRRHFRKMLRQSLKAYLFIAPATVILFLFHFLPIFYAFLLSLYKRISAVKGIVPPAENFAGFENYTRLLGDPDWWNALWNTLGYALVSVFLGIACALGVALMLDKVQHGKNIYRTLFFIPYVTSLIAIASVWNLIFAPSASNALVKTDPNKPGGLVNWIFSAIGIPIQRWLLENRGVLQVLFDNGPADTDWFSVIVRAVIVGGLVAGAIWIYHNLRGGLWGWAVGLIYSIATILAWSTIVEIGHSFSWQGGWGGPSLAMMVMIIISTWHILGFNVVLLLAGLTNISKELYEAAKIDGAQGWAMFSKMTVPLLSPTLFFMLIVGTIGAFQSFTIFFAIFNGSNLPKSTTVLSIFYYDVTFSRGSGSDTSGFGYSSTIVIMMVILIMGVSFLQQKILAKRVNYD